MKYTSLFSFKDRIGRLQFFVSYAAIMLLSFIIAFLSMESFSPFLLVFQVMLSWPVLCICVKRGHDCNINAFVSVLLVITSVIVCLFCVANGSMFWNVIVSIGTALFFLVLPTVNDKNRFGVGESRISVVGKHHYLALSIWSVLLVVFTVFCGILYKVPELPLSNDKLDLDSLALTSQMVIGRWIEKDVINDDSNAWTGSCFAVKEDDKYVHFVTNNHVLGLDSLSKSDLDGSIEVALYELKIKTPSGQTVKVSKIRHRRDDIDLAILLVKRKNLEKGKDYVIVPFNPAITPKIGDFTVAVGAPRRLEGTHTFGRISALRNDPFIQIDTPINPGNSGGPLFIRRNKKYSLVGINTFVIRNSESLNFAIKASLINVGKYTECSADKHGAAKLLSLEYNVKGVVK